MVWLAGAVVFWVRLAGGWVVAARMRSMLVRRAPPEWQEILRRLGAQIGLSRPVRLLVSALVQVPTVVGWLRPVVLVPVGRSAVCLPGIWRRCCCMNWRTSGGTIIWLDLFESVAEALLFYPPRSGGYRQHRAERELCCDDVAVSVSGDALTYARALAQLESYRPAHSVPRLPPMVDSVPPHRKVAGPITASRHQRARTGRPRSRYPAGGRGIRIVRPVRRASRLSDGVDQTKYL